MPQPTVLISGAGIAGPALAFWLTRSGSRVTIVELADGIPPGGQTVDLRGAGGDVVERMGLIDQMRQRSLDQRGVAWIKADGSRRTDMPVTAFDGNGLVSKLEILRGTRRPRIRSSTASAPASRVSIRTTMRLRQR
jgi:2-polyprenyl-6-methoxyphenol hydroxylase-like FAD-dependent oxidoreductase